MAEERKVPLSIIIRTVDKATAGIQHINEKLDELTRPTREFGKALKELGEKSGFNRVGEAFHEVGKAAKETFIHLLEGAAIIGETTHLVLEMVEGFAKLHDTADRLGIEVDLLAGLEYGASKSGASVEDLDAGLKTLTEGLGQAKAGTGHLLKFLNQISPVFARQVIGAHGVAEALGLIANGVAKLPDSARRAALAEKTLGLSTLAPFLARGAKGIQELIEEHARLAGSQQEAADAAAKVDDAMKELHASTDGVKAALVTGLSPALTEVIKKLSEWLVEHRSDVAAWAEDIGKKIPGAVDEVVKSVKGAAKWVGDFVEDIGGWKVAALALGVAIEGPLITALAALSVAMLATPFGQVLLALTPIVAAVAALVSETEAFEAVAERLGFKKKKPTEAEAFKSDMDAMMQSGRDAAVAEANARAALDDDPVVQKARLLADQHDAFLSIPESVDPKDAARRGRMAALEARIAQQSAAHPGPQDVNIKVDFANAPKGMRATVVANGAAKVDLTTGHQMGAGL